VPEEAEANSLVGTPDEIMGKLEALRRAGVEYVIMSCGGTDRTFACQLAPAFRSPIRDRFILGANSRRFRPCQPCKGDQRRLDLGRTATDI
jgi:hypothetical protein